MPASSEAVWQRNQELHKKIIALLPRTSRAMAEAIGMPVELLRRHINRLSTLEVICCTPSSEGPVWQLGERPERAMQRRMAERSKVSPCGAYTLPTVSIPEVPAWVLPAATHKVLADGVPYTYQPAPPPRFSVALTPGTGVISQDNPGLARLAGKAQRKHARGGQGHGVAA
jgi:hypothetical protein